MSRAHPARTLTRVAALAGVLALTSGLALPAQGSAQGATPGAAHERGPRVAFSDGTYSDGEHRSVVAIIAVPKPGSWERLDVICTGVLVGEREVLTAAHCLKGYSPEQLLVSQPGTDLARGEFVGVVAQMAHRAFTRAADGGGIHDIALLRTAYPLNGEPVRLGVGSPNAPLTVVGYGADENGRHPNLPRWARLRDLSNSGQRFYPRYESAWHLVAGNTPGSGKATACGGDSGGPLLSGTGTGAKVVGIVGYGAKDCTTGWPALFTRTSAYSKWVTSAAQALSARAKKTTLTYRAKSGTSAVVQSRARGITLQHNAGDATPILIDTNADGVADYVAQEGRITQGRVPDLCRSSMRSAPGSTTWVWNSHCFASKNPSFLAFAVHGSGGVATVGGVVLP